MSFRYKAALLLAALALAITPALAIAHGKAHTSGTKTSTAKKYGKYCQGESKKHVKGMKGTPFSVCVTAAAHMAKGTTTSAKVACKAETKKHVKGMKGSPFTVCVKGANAAAKAAR